MSLEKQTGPAEPPHTRRDPETHSSTGAAAGAQGLSAPAEEKEGRFLKNPLPVPKRRPHVRMEFDLTDDWDIPEEEEHFDFEIAEDDDFDI